MSERYPGGLIRKTPPTVTGPTDGEGGSAPGIWTLEEVAYYQKAGLWPKGILDRELYTWGQNSDGQLGQGDNNVARSSPTQVGSEITWEKLGASQNWNSNFAIKSNGTLWGWGHNTSGTLGVNDLFNRSSPTQVGALTTWSEVSIFRLHVLAIKTDGTLWAWGLNNYGQVGNNNIANPFGEVSSPIQIGSGTDWYKVNAGKDFSLALKTDGTLWSWGQADFGGGKTGHNDTVDRSSPTQIGALTTWASISAGERTSAAVKTDGTFWIWGNQNFGRLGNNVSVNSGISSPVQLGSLTNWEKPSFCGEGSFAIKTDGTLWGWGLNTKGRIGDNTGISRSSPVQIGADTDWSEVTGGTYSGIAIKTDGTLWTWGSNGKGELGQNTEAALIHQSSPAQVGALTTWFRIGANTEAAFGITKG